MKDETTHATHTTKATIIINCVVAIEKETETEKTRKKIHNAQWMVDRVVIDS